MNRFSVSDILIKSIKCFYILLDDGFNVKATNDDYPNVSPSQTFETGKNFLNFFTKKYQDKFTSAFASLVEEKEVLCVVRAPIQLEKNSLNIKWNICLTRGDDNAINGFELLGVQSKLPSKESNIETGSVIGDNSFALFNNDTDPFFSCDLQGNLIKANTAFANLLERSTDELLNTPFLSLVAPANIHRVQDHFSKAIKGIPQHHVCSLNGKRGKKVTVNIINTPLIEEGVFTGVNAYVKEITGKVFTEKASNKDEKRLKVVLSKLKKILDSSLDMICAFDENGKFTYVSSACKEILGYRRKELIGKRYEDFVYAEDVELSKKSTENIKKGSGTTNFENRFYRKDGSVARLVWSSRWEETDRRFYSIARDATEKKESEAALKASEEKYRILFYNHPIPSWIYDWETLLFLEVNEAAINHYGYSREEFLKMSLKDIISDKECKKFEDYRHNKCFPEHTHNGLWIHKKKNNELLYAEITSTSIDYNGKKARLVLSIDRTEQTIAEEELKKSNERYYFLSEASFDGIWDCDLKTNEVQWNEGAKKMFGISDPSVVLTLDWWYNNVHKEDRERVDRKLKSDMEQGISKWEDEYRFRTANNTYKYIYNRGYIIYDANKKPVRLIGAMQDLTERKEHENMLQKLNNSLEKRATELAESNAELERFAYVASHDLQEPLRMVTSFLQLLEKRYKEKLDQKAHEYINYAVDGAERMKRLILDLLEYSRVNSSKAEVEDVDVNEVVEDLKLTYKNFLKETKGTINTKKLPVIKGNKTQILQLFQNIIGNACKYKSHAPPVIDISYEEEKSHYQFAIADNGIGIDPKFFHKIFIIFQRLHNRDEYSGTGIGLAICKKIIDKHGGKIWVTSTPGHGSTFYFTLPKSK